MDDLIIVGGGPGGYVAAIAAAQKGGRVALVDEAKLGGTCLNWGCIPTKALVESAARYRLVLGAERFGVRADNVSYDFPAVQARKNEVVARLGAGVRQLMASNGVRVVTGRGELLGGGRVAVRTTGGGVEELEARYIIVATGSVPARLPVPGADLPGVIDSNGMLDIPAVPRRLAIVGGGVIGIEFASIFRAFGAEVTVVEMLPSILPAVDEEISRRLALSLRKQGVAISTGARVQSIERGGDALELVVEVGGATSRIAADVVLVATGRKPNLDSLDLERAGVSHSRGGISVDRRMATNVAGIYAIGDVTGGIMLAHVASAQGLVAVDNIFGRPREIDYTAVPNCIYSFPEVASVGLSEKEALQKGLAVEVARFPFAASGRALIHDEVEGMVKIVGEAGSGRILGVHIVAPHASELIHEGVLAVSRGLTAGEWAEMIHAHPTLSEATGEAVHILNGLYIHTARRR